jgi:small-conductance mechanosensitive channel
METSLRRLISLRESIALLQAQIERIDEETLVFTQNGLGQDRPYPITLLDELQYQLALAQDELSAQETTLTSAKADAKMQAAQLEDREAQRRRILEQAGNDNSLDQERATENAAWAVRAMETAVEVANAEVLQAEKAQQLAQKSQDLLARKVDLVKTHFLFTRAILDEQLNQLDGERAQITAQRSKAESLANESMEKVKALADADGPEKLAEREAQTEWLTTYQRQKILLEQGLELNLAKRDLWERRYNLSQGLGLTSLNDWEESTRGVVRRLESAREAMENQLSQLRGRMATVVESAPDNSAVESWKNVQVKALAAHQSALETALTESAQASVLAQRFLSEISETRKGLSWRERADRGWAGMLNIWRVELYSIGDSSVTVGKMIVALLVLIVGLTLVGRTTHFVSNRLLAHLPMPDSSRVNIERGLRYFFILLVFLFALRVVNIPLTIFTFLGGTLAIAVGFGAQNILNNFISGLILMAERPVRVGDLIEVDGTTGVIEEIGARSTRVRMAVGIHVVLPNSVLLENKVINWTLTDQTVRTSVSVGVAYGSDPQEVMALISRAALSVELVEKTPEHFVLLEDFSDSSLLFTIHYWVSIATPISKRLSESQLRLAIIELFEENGISIPFPQRDLNLTQPVAVRMVAPTEESSQKSESPNP